MPFKFTRTAGGLIILEYLSFVDPRGFFQELYKFSDFERHGLGLKFVQDNISLSRINVLRGLHYQLPPAAQGKLVFVLKGTIYDVAVDIRRSSDKFRSWYGYELSESNRKALYIPPGFAHGFVCLSETALVFYKCTAEYSREHERGIRWDDPGIAIDWPVASPILSEKDEGLPLLEDASLFP